MNSSETPPWAPDLLIISFKWNALPSILARVHIMAITNLLLAKLSCNGRSKSTASERFRQGSWSGSEQHQGGKRRRGGKRLVVVISYRESRAGMHTCNHLYHPHKWRCSCIRWSHNRRYWFGSGYRWIQLYRRNCKAKGRKSWSALDCKDQSNKNHRKTEMQ